MNIVHTGLKYNTKSLQFVNTNLILYYNIKYFVLQCVLVCKFVRGKQTVFNKKNLDSDSLCRLSNIS